MFLLGLLATFPYWGCYRDMDDEAVTVLGAARLLQGEIPYRDWTSRATPGSYFLCALYFAVVGWGPLATRSAMAIVSSLTGLTLQAISDRLLSGPARYLPWVLWTCAGINEKPGLNYHWFGVLFTSLTLLALLGWTENPQQRRRALLLGCLAALSSWVLQSNGLSSLLMIVLVWLRLRTKGLAWVVLGYTLTQLTLWLPWWGYRNEVWHNHLEILGRHVQFNRHAYSWNFLLELARSYQGIDARVYPIHALAAASHFGHLCLQYGLFYFSIGTLVVLAERSRQKNRLLVAYACLAWGLTTGYSQAPDYLSYASPAFGLASAILLQPTRRSLLLAWMGLEILGWGARTLSIQQAYQYPCETRMGTLWCSTPQEAEANNQLHIFLEQNCPPGSVVLCYPYFCREYTLENLHNPIQDPLLVPWLWDEQAFNDCHQRLEQGKVPFILYRPLSAQSLHQDYPAIPIEEFEQAYQVEEKRLFKNYQRVWDNGSYQVWKRVPSPAP